MPQRYRPWYEHIHRFFCVISINLNTQIQILKFGLDHTCSCIFVQVDLTDDNIQ